MTDGQISLFLMVLRKFLPPPPPFPQRSGLDQVGGGHQMSYYRPHLRQAAEGSGRAVESHEPTPAQRPSGTTSAASHGTRRAQRATATRARRATRPTIRQAAHRSSRAEQERSHGRAEPSDGSDSVLILGRDERSSHSRATAELRHAGHQPQRSRATEPRAPRQQSSSSHERPREEETNRRPRAAEQPAATVQQTRRSRAPPRQDPRSTRPPSPSATAATRTEPREKRRSGRPPALTTLPRSRSKAATELRARAERGSATGHRSPQEPREREGEQTATSTSAEPPAPPQRPETQEEGPQPTRSHEPSRRAQRRRGGEAAATSRRRPNQPRQIYGWFRRRDPSARAPGDSRTPWRFARAGQQRGRSRARPCPRHTRSPAQWL